MPAREGIFVIGDVASLQQEGHPMPGVAPAAMQMGKHVARSIRRLLQEQPLLPFRYHDRGSFAVTGRGAAVGLTLRQRLNLTGWPTYLAWAGIHAFFLIGFRNRVSVMLEWTYYFLTKRREARLISGGVPHEFPPVTASHPALDHGEEARPAPVH